MPLSEEFCLVGPLTPVPPAPEPPIPEPGTDGNKTFKMTIGAIGLAFCAFVLLIVVGRRFH